MRGDALGSGVLRGEHARRALVAGRARGRRQLLVDGAADDRVHELQRAALGQDPAGAQRVGRFGGLASVEVRERGSVPDERAVADDRRRAGELLGAARGNGRAAPGPPRRRRRAPRRARPRRDPAPASRSAPASSRRKNGFPPVSAWQVRQSAGIASGTAARTSSADASSLSAVGRTSAGAPPSASIAATAAPPGSPSRPRGDDEQDRSVAEPPSEIRQEPQRRGVGPVRIVDEQRERPARGRGSPSSGTARAGRRTLPPGRAAGARAPRVGRRAAPPHSAPRPRRPPRRRRRGPRARAAAARPRTRTRARARPREPRAASAPPRARSRAPRRPVRSCRSPPDPPRPPRAPHPPPRLRRPHGSRQAQRSAPAARPARRPPSSSSVGSSGPGDSTALPLVEREGSTASRRRGRDHRALRLVKPLIGESVSARRSLASSANATAPQLSPRHPQRASHRRFTPLIEPRARNSPMRSSSRRRLSKCISATVRARR